MLACYDVLLLHMHFSLTTQLLSSLFALADEDDAGIAGDEAGVVDTTNNNEAVVVDDDDDDDDDDDEEQESTAEPSKSGLREKFQSGVASAAARKRKGRKYTSKSRTKGSVNAPKKVSQSELQRILKKSYTVTKSVGPKGNKKDVREVVNMKNEPYFELSNGVVFCTCCNVPVAASPPNKLGQHCASASHKKARDNKGKEDADDDELGKMAQSRLRKENLQGSTKEQKDNMILLRGFARGNVSLSAASDMGVS